MKATIKTTNLTHTMTVASAAEAIENGKSFASFHNETLKSVKAGGKKVL